MCDDAFIDFRVIQNILAGHGPVFNVGERVETYTNPLWVLLLTGWHAAGLPVEAGSVFLGLVLSTIGIILAEWGALVLSSLGQRTKAGALKVPLGALVASVLPPMWDFATSGLETGLTLGWLGFSWWLLARSLTRMRVKGAPHASVPPDSAEIFLVSCVLGLGVLIRPDLLPFSFGFLVAWLAIAASARGLGETVRILCKVALGAALLPACYQVFRMGYFAELVPNSALAKEAEKAHWPQGWAYARDFFMVYSLWLPLGLLLVRWLWRLRSLVRSGERVGTLLTIVPAAAAALHSLYVIRVGGDFMHARLLLPGAFAVMLPFAVVNVPPPRSWRRAGWALGWVLLILLWAVVCAFRLRVPYAGGIGPAGIADERGFYTALAGKENPITPDDYAAMTFAKQGRSLRRFAESLSATPSAQGSPGRRVLLIDLADDPQLGELPPELKRVFPLSPGTHGDIYVVAVRWSVGLCGYLAGPHVHLVDRRGLTDPIGSRLLLEGRGRPGHEKLLRNAWLIARFGGAGSSSELDANVVAARKALSCGELAELDSVIRQPLTLELFLRNIALAQRHHRLRIPQDPQQAVRSFCPDP